MSAIRPKGSKNIAAARREEVAIQLNETALSDSSLSMDGRAMLTEDDVNGVRNELKAAMRATTVLSGPFFAAFVDSKAFNP
jgi:hypothetical protein